MELPLWLSRLRTQLVSVGMRVRSLASLGGLGMGIAASCGIGCRCHRDPAVAVAVAIGSNWTPICRRYGPKNKTKPRKKR